MSQTRKLFVLQFARPGNQASQRQHFIIAPDHETAGNAADNLIRPGERVNITEAHEPLSEAFGNDVIDDYYAGLQQPEPATA